MLYKQGSDLLRTHVTAGRLKAPVASRTIKSLSTALASPLPRWHEHESDLHDALPSRIVDCLLSHSIHCEIARRSGRLLSHATRSANRRHGRMSLRSHRDGNGRLWAVPPMIELCFLLVAGLG